MWEIVHEEKKTSTAFAFKVERKAITGGWLVRVTQNVPDRHVFSELGGYDVPSDPVVTITFAVDPSHVWDLK